MNLKVRLALLNFLEFAVWGAYLTSMGTYLGKIGMASQIGWFYAVQGVVSIFMPALMGAGTKAVGLLSSHGCSLHVWCSLYGNDR